LFSKVFISMFEGGKREGSEVKLGASNNEVL